MEKEQLMKQEDNQENVCPGREVKTDGVTWLAVQGKQGLQSDHWIQQQ